VSEAISPKSEAKPHQSKTKKVLLKDLGPSLPMGVADENGKLHRALACKPWRGKEEREVGKLKSEAGKGDDFATALLSHMFTHVGPHDFSSMEDAAKRAVLMQMHLGDVLYMYVWLRTQCVDPVLNISLACPSPRCDRGEFDFKADLRTVEVRTAPSPEAVRWTYDLCTPIEIRGGQVRGFELAPTTWSTMVETSQSNEDAQRPNLGAAKMDVIRSCIRSVLDRGEMVLIPSEIDELTKVDIEALAHLIDENEIGPALVVEATCPKCGRNFKTPIDWSYENFFETSSLS
jgi:hypothetical protein